MIGVTFCGKTGEGATRVEGTLMVVTCAACQKVASPDARRYRGEIVPLTLGTGLIHAGAVHTLRDLRASLVSLERLVFGCVFDPETSASIVGLIEGVIQNLDEEGS